MNYEQKYKKALEWMQSLYSGLHGATKEDAEHYFPELKENKSERVRKGLIKTVSSLLDNTILYHTDITKEEALTWLENQKVTGEEIIFRPIVGTDIRIAAKQALEKIDIGKKVVLAFNGAYILVNGKTVGEIDSEYDAWLEKQGEKVTNVNGEDYGIDGLYHAIRILEGTVGEVIGYQSDDGILEHKAAINAVKELYKKQGEIKPKTLDADKVIEWLKTHGNLVPIVTIRINEVIDKFKRDFGL